MAFEVIKGAYYPEPVGNLLAGVAMSNSGVASGGLYAIMAIQRTGLLKGIWAGNSSIPTPVPLILTIEDIPIDGNLDIDNPILYHPNASTVYTPDVATGHTLAEFTNPVPVSRGDVVAVGVRVENPSLTYNMNFRRLSGSTAMGIPASRTINASGVISNVSSASFDFVMEYTEGASPYHPNVFPFTQTSNNAFNSGSAYNELGMEFTLPFDLVIEGAWLSQITSSSTEYDVIIRDSDDVVIDQTTRKVMAGAGGATVQPTWFSKDITLKAGETYRLTAKPTTTTNITIRGGTLSDDLKSAISGANYFKRIERKDSGPWTVTNNSMIYMGFILSGIQKNGTLGEYYIKQNDELKRI